MFWNLPAPPWFPIYLSLKVAGLATLMALITGVAVARYQMRKKTMRSKVLDALCTLPMILPPTVLGYYLILIIGRRGVLGHWLQEMGIQLIFTWQGAVVAASVVVFPLIYKSARAALESVDPRFEAAARTLGAGEGKIFFSVTLPLAWRGILAGSMLAFARGMGEFGATLMIAGNIPGKTQTLSLAIYDAFQAGDDDKAMSLVLLTSVICLSILIGADSFLSSRTRSVTPSPPAFTAKSMRSSRKTRRLRRRIKQRLPLRLPLGISVIIGKAASTSPTRMSPSWNTRRMLLMRSSNMKEISRSILR